MSGSILKSSVAAISAVAVLGALAVGGYMLRASRLAALEKVPPAEKFPWALRTARIVKRDLTAGFPVLAKLSSQTEIAIIPQISGVIRQMGAREGQEVKKGWLLVELDTQELDDKLAALKASHRAAKDEVELKRKDLERQEILLHKGVSTQKTVDTLRTALRTAIQRVKQLRAEIEAQKTRLKYGTILSPVDGVIAARLQEPGDLAAPGRTIYKIVAAAGAKLKITVPQSVAARLHKGSEIQLRHGSTVKTVSISRVFPSLDELSMGSAEADLSSIPFGLPSGSRLPGRVILKRWPSALIVPRTALILSADGGKATVFRIATGARGGAHLEHIEVKILASGREGVAIQGAISAGDRVAIAQESELLKLKDGDPVRPESERGA